MSDNVAARQAAMAEETMAKAQEQHQAHAYQQLLAQAASRGAPEQERQQEQCLEQ